MIKWEKPMLISLSGAPEVRGLCDPGSGDSGECIGGNSAGNKCGNGNAADIECRFGNFPIGICNQGEGENG